MTKTNEINKYRKEARLFEIRSPFRQSLYATARMMKYPPLKAWQASGHLLNWRKAKIDQKVAKKMHLGKF